MQDTLQASAESQRLDQDQHVDKNLGNIDQTCTHNTMKSYTGDLDSLQTPTIGWKPLITQITNHFMSHYPLLTQLSNSHTNTTTHSMTSTMPYINW